MPIGLEQRRALLDRLIANTSPSSRHSRAIELAIVNMMTTSSIPQLVPFGALALEQCASYGITLVVLVPVFIVTRQD